MMITVESRDPIAGVRTDRRSSTVVSDGPTAGWLLTLTIDDTNRRVADSLLALGNGRFGTRGLPPGSNGVTVGAGVFDTHSVPGQLLGPVWNDLGLEPPSVMEAELDLLHGVLRTWWRPEPSAPAIQTIHLVPIAGSDVHALRVQGPAAILDRVAAVPPLAPPPTPSPPGVTVTCDICRADDRAQMAVAGTVGAIAAVAQQWNDDDAQPPSVTRFAAYAAATGPVAADGLLEVAAGSLARTVVSGFDRLLAEHRAAWEDRWDRAAVDLPAVRGLERSIRFAQFHLLSSSSDAPETAIGARGNTGPAYMGHVFWDTDVFVVPALAAMAPPLARSALMYRWNRLEAARRWADQTGRQGVRFPWESAAVGDDVTPSTGRDLRGNVVPIRTGLLEEHIVADVAWAASNYVDWTGDQRFLERVAVEILIETARFWQARIETGDDGRGHIGLVIGPDEYHESVDDNAFTNAMAHWNLQAAADVGRERGSVSHSEWRAWLETAERLVDGFDAASGRHEQFAGFFDLEPVPMSSLGQPPVSADVLLGRERIQRVQIIKQADVLMLHHLLPDRVPPGSLSADIDYYLPRTAHGSSLSPAITASVLARAGRLAEAIEWFDMAARFDLDDLSGTTAGGLHLATMGGLWQALVQGFLGVRPTSAGLIVDPAVPDVWGTVTVRVQYHSAVVELEASQDTLLVTSSAPVLVTLGENRIAYDMEPNRPLVARRTATEWEIR